MTSYRVVVVSKFTTDSLGGCGEELHQFAQSVFGDDLIYTVDEIYDILRGMKDDGCSRIEVRYTIKNEDGISSPKDIELYGIEKGKQSPSRIFPLVSRKSSFGD